MTTQIKKSRPRVATNFAAFAALVLIISPVTSAFGDEGDGMVSALEPAKKQPPSSDTGQAAPGKTGPKSVTASRRASASAGVSPDEVLAPGQMVGINKDSDAGRGWEFGFKGFMRAPMRIGFGKQADQIQFHTPPVTPDENFTNWQYTNNNPGPWVEMLFQYGNDRVKMTTALASYNITSGGYRELQAQLGIDRAFLTLNFPDALGDSGGLSWNVGVFSDRYGTAGRYDAGMYETYLFGRTRVAGETLRGNLFLGEDWTVLAEHGIGAKLNQQIWTDRATMALPDGYAAHEPYPGPTQQGSTLLHHAHLGLAYRDNLTLTLHYIDAFTRDLRATAGSPYGGIAVSGADVKFLGGAYGDAYLGFSHVSATNANAVSDAIELLHSQGGWQLTNNYFGGNGTGTIDTVSFQYRFSMAAFLLRPKSWWGDGADLVTTVFGMFNSVDSEAVPSNGAGSKKLKLGADIVYTPLPFLGFGARVDVVQPDMDNSERSFVVLSPRAVLRTNFVTHEQIIIQYTLYSNNDQVLLPHPYGGPGAAPPYGTDTADKGVLTIAASMWW